MNSNWRNRPTTVDYISRNINYIVSIDESGTSNLKQVQKAKLKGVSVPDSERHFAVTATVIDMNDFETARKMVMDLKYKYWDNGLFLYKEGTKRVCFHSRDIRRKTGAFSPSIIDYDTFISDLSSLMRDVPLTLYASHIDKMRHVNKYAHPDGPYDLCMTFVLERILLDTLASDSIVIILEARGTAEDKALLNFIKSLMQTGSQYCPASQFQRIKGVYFNPKWCKAQNDQLSYWELELADLYAHPIYNHFV